VEAVGILDDVLTRMQAHQVKKNPPIKGITFLVNLGAGRTRPQNTMHFDF